MLPALSFERMAKRRAGAMAGAQQGDMGFTRSSHVNRSLHFVFCLFLAKRKDIRSIALHPVSPFEQ